MKKNIIWSLCTVLAFLLMMSLTAAAQTDNAGNVFISDSTVAQQTVERDLYWAGSSRSFNGYQIGKSFLAAGRDITVTESTIGGSLRAGGYTITLNGVDIADNITAAGYSLQMSGITASGVYLVGYSVYFNGTADCVSLAGNTVTLDGEIHGNADISAAAVVLGENLQVDGTLTVQSGNEPALPSGAKIGEFIFQQTETAPEPEETAVRAEGSKSSSGFGRFIRDLLGTLLLAALICLLLGAESLKKPAEMLLERPLPMLGTGFAGVFVIPGIILILLLIRIGFPSAGLLALLYAIACIFSLTYAGTSLANTLLPQFTDNKILNNEWICSLIGALVFQILRKIPVIGHVLQAAALFYTIGYFIQVIFLRLKGNKPSAIKGALNDAPEKDLLEPVGNTPTAEPEDLSEDPLSDASAENDVPEEIPSDENEPEPEEEVEAGSDPDTE